MNQFTISKSDQTYQFLKRMDDDPSNYHDFCSYYRAVFKRSFFLLVAGIVVGTLLLNMLALPVLWAIFGAAPNNIVTVVGSFSWVLAVLLLSSLFALHRFEYTRKVTRRPPGPLRTWYRATKGKYCPIIKFTP